MRQDIEHALALLHDLLSQVKGKWYVIGTTGLMLADYPVIPKDIDILTDKDTALAISRSLEAYRSPVQLKANEKFRSQFSRYTVGGISVEVMGDLQVNTPNGWTSILPLITDPPMIVVNGRSFAVPSKTEQFKIYSLFDREKDGVILTMLGKN